MPAISHQGLGATVAPNTVANLHRGTWAAILLSGSAFACAAPWPGEGRWVASSHHQAGSLTLVLGAAAGGTDQAIQGQVQQQQGALPLSVIAASGHWRAPLLTLTWRTPDGAAWTLTAQLVGPERLQGTLAWPGGTVQTLTFVRP